MRMDYDELSIIRDENLDCYDFYNLIIYDLINRFGYDLVKETIEKLEA